jgi:hypothetical protein
MAKTIFNAADRDALLERIDQLQPDAKPQFGEFTAPRMVCHLIDSLRVASGEKAAASKNSGMDNPILRWLIVYYMPWPKGKVKTVPEMLSTTPTEFKADVSTLRELMRGAAQRGPDGKWGRHPAFGDVPGKMYGALIYRHTDHHLKQFGV